MQPSAVESRRLQGFRGRMFHLRSLAKGRNPSYVGPCTATGRARTQDNRDRIGRIPIGATVAAEARTPVPGDRRSRPPDDDLPRALVHYTIALCAAAAVVLAGLLPRVGWGQADSGASFWIFATFLLAGELLPIQSPWRRTQDKVPISSAFAFAILISFGVGPAIVAYAAASILNGLWSRSPAIKLALSASQYVLSVAAGALTLRFLGHPAPVSAVGDALLAIVAAGVVWFAAGHALGGTAAALTNSSRLSPYLLHDLPFQIWTAGSLLILAPVVVVSANESLA